MTAEGSPVSTAIRDGLSALGVQRLVLAIHDQSFPCQPDEDLGRGSPYGRGARALLGFAGGLGFDGVQLGPQGDTSLVNPSPYDGALFSRNPSSLALATLAEDPAWAPLLAGLLPAAVAARPAGRPDRVDHAHAWRATRAALGQMHRRFRDGADPGRLRPRFDAFRSAQGAALEPDSLFEALSVLHGTDDWRRWPALDRDLFAPGPAGAAQARDRRAALHSACADDVERHLFGQFALAEQHAALRAAAAATPRPMALFGDLQIGFSHRDVWSRRALFRADYLMGAPPSRTNPAGQPWGYPVLDPQQPEAVMALMIARVDRMLQDCDGIRLDHPHGLVCPWVYAAADPDPAVAVGQGARLFCSPNLPAHPALAALAIPAPDQLSADPGIARYADDWVRALRDDQVARYGLLFDAIMARVAAAGRRASDVVCEVLSTWPYPLRRVMDRHGLGRFCVTQKADLTRADDVYRSENAGPEDWIMVGNHDTAPVWALAESWQGSALAAERAAHLAQRLMPGAAQPRARLAQWLAADARHLCQGMFAELFAGRARRVSVFFADLFGARETYNRPGVVSPDNWTLRLPPDFEALYRERVARAAAMNVPLAVALACAAAVGRSDAGAGAPEVGELAAVGRRLLAAARTLGPSLPELLLSAVETALG